MVRRGGNRVDVAGAVVSDKICDRCGDTHELFCAFCGYHPDGRHCERLEPTGEAHDQLTRLRAGLATLTGRDASEDVDVLFAAVCKRMEALAESAGSMATAARELVDAQDAYDRESSGVAPMPFTILRLARATEALRRVLAEVARKESLR